MTASHAVRPQRCVSKQSRPRPLGGGFFQSQCPPDLQGVLLQRFYQRESRLLRRRRAAVSVSEFQVLSCVGRGAFGEVRSHETAEVRCAGSVR